MDMHEKAYSQIDGAYVDLLIRQRDELSYALRGLLEVAAWDEGRCERLAFADAFVRAEFALTALKDAKQSSWKPRPDLR